MSLAPTVVTSSVGLWPKLEFYMEDTDKWSDTNGVTSQCDYAKYNNSWNVALPVELLN